MKDTRLFFKLALGFSDHHKIRPLSDAAFRCIVEAIDWCRSQPNDGFLPSRYAVARWGLDVLHELATNDPDKPTLIECENGWQIHDYAAMNDTKADIEARSQRNKANGQRGGLAKSKRVAKRVASKSPSESLAVVVVEKERDIPTYVENVSPDSTAREPRSAPVKPEANRLVSEIIPKGHPSAVKTELRLQASALLNDGQDAETVADALRLWLTKSVHPKVLPSLVSELINSRDRPPLTVVNGRATGTDAKALGWAELAATIDARQTRAELEGSK